MSYIMEDGDNKINAVVAKIQACWRGYRARKKLQEVHDWFREVALDIDGMDNIGSHPADRRISMCVVRQPLPSLLQGNSLSQTRSCSDDAMASIEEILQVTSEPNCLDKEKLCHRKQTIAMELFWVQQAVESRRNYLLLKRKIDAPHLEYR